ncbi:MAG: AAA-like domain-containing protein, partial [Nitrospiraceae bacterium]|nr:AAA-like domain-containing protein [Nitrospiraceae bacterium]
MTFDRLLGQLCAYASRKLNLANRSKEYWDESLGVKERCTTYFEEYLLPKSAKPLLLALDEADLLFEHGSVSSDFFGLLRFWNEQAKSQPVWKRLKIIVSHSTEPYLLIDTPNQSPFNVGLGIRLEEFNEAEAHELALRHSSKWTKANTKDLMALVGGHPYLVRKALYD